MKKITFLPLFFSALSFAQVGVNTSNPQGVFNIDANKNNPASGTPLVSQTLDDFTVLANGYTGIGNTSPQRKLHVNALNQDGITLDPIRIQNLATLPSNTSAMSLVIDPSTGDVYKNNTVSTEGQILRIGLNPASYNTTESSLRFDANDDTGEMKLAPNSAPNFINTIIGASITEGVVVGAGQGSPARATDRINLQPGVYKIQVRLVGGFVSGNNTNNIFVKCIVNNNEYSLQNYSNPTNQISSYLFEDFINITGSAQPVDFDIQPVANNFTVISNISPGTGQSYRSLILIQRLR